MPFYAQLTIPFFMTLTGYAWSGSFARCDGLRGWYAPRNLARRAARFVLPYLPALMVQLLALGTPDDWLSWLVSGGYQMPGSYYPILMLELVVLFPVVVWLCARLMKGRWAQRFGWLPGLMVVLALHCAYEFLTWAFDMPRATYRLLVFRYGVFLYGGVLIHGWLERGIVPWRELFVLVPFGLAYIVLVGYVGYQPQVLFRYDTWFRSAAPTALWVLPLVTCVVAHEEALHEWVKRRAGQVARAVCDALATLGRASYHIFVVQMLWFGLVWSYLPTSTGRAVLWFLLALVVCCSVGVNYFQLEGWVRGLLKERESAG